MTALTPGKAGGTKPEKPAFVPIEVNPRNLVSGKTVLSITPEQIDATLDDAGRSPASLIAAQAILGDHRYLVEAAETNPDDPEVQFWILANRVLPEQRAQWLAKFKESDPGNALPNYLAAQEAFRTNDYEAGIGELRAAIDKEYLDYSQGLRKQVGQLYESTGLFDAENVRYASARMGKKPHIEIIQELSQRMIDQHQKLRAAGEDDAAKELESLGLGMLETVAAGGASDSISSRTLLLFMQEKLLAASADPDEKLALVTAEREQVASLGEQVRAIFAREELLDESQLDGYAYRLHDIGEIAAAEWLVEQVGELDAPEE